VGRFVAICGFVLACASQVRNGTGPEELPPPLRIRLAYQVEPAPECSTWYAGLRKAREWAACDSFTNTSLIKNACQERIQACARGGDICPLLGPGLGPPASFEDLGPISRNPADRNIIRGKRGTQSVWRGSTVFNQHLCDDLSWYDVLGSTLLHEALHHCHDGYGISDFPSGQSGCAADALERFCTGISSEGGV